MLTSAYRKKKKKKSNNQMPPKTQKIDKTFKNIRHALIKVVQVYIYMCGTNPPSI